MIFLNEIWANIKNYQDYQVSNLGNVRSYKNGMVKVINGWVQNTGYKTVVLNNKKYSVHRLVAETFIHKPVGKNVVNHKDGNKLNNNINKDINKPTNDKMRFKFNLNWFYLLILLMIGVLWFTNLNSSNSKEIPYNEFKSYVQQGYVNRIIGYDAMEIQPYFQFI